MKSVGTLNLYISPSRTVRNACDLKSLYRHTQHTSARDRDWVEMFFTGHCQSGQNTKERQHLEESNWRSLGIRQEVLGYLGNMGKKKSRTQQETIHYVILVWRRGGDWNSTCLGKGKAPSILASEWQSRLRNPMTGELQLVGSLAEFGLLFYCWWTHKGHFHFYSICF